MPASVHNSQMLLMILGPKNTDDYVYASPAYINAHFETY